MDIVHIGDVNFYKRAIIKLSADHEIVITVLKRGNLADIVKKEFPKLEVIQIGNHRSSKVGKIIGTIEREVKFISLFIGRKFDRITSFGFYPAVAGKLFGIKSILFHDDIEYNQMFYLCSKFGDKFIVPEPINFSGKNIIKYPGFKELASLYHFKPNNKVLKEYGIQEDKYVFVREISPISLNYDHHKRINLTKTFEMLKNQGYTILYYPEKEEYWNNYRLLCRLVKIPVFEIHSLLYYAKFNISAGDGISRESSILGTPIIYTGGRNMQILNPLVEINGIIVANNEEDVENSSKKLLQNKPKINLRKKVKKKLEKNWPDWAQIIVKEVLK